MSGVRYSRVLRAERDEALRVLRMVETNMRVMRGEGSGLIAWEGDFLFREIQKVLRSAGIEPIKAATVERNLT